MHIIKSVRRDDWLTVLSENLSKPEYVCGEQTAHSHS